jgi:hypothetical protein
VLDLGDRDLECSRLHRTAKRAGNGRHEGIALLSCECLHGRKGTRLGEVLGREMTRCPTDYTLGQCVPKLGPGADLFPAGTTEGRVDAGLRGRLEAHEGRGHRGNGHGSGGLRNHTECLSCGPAEARGNTGGRRATRKVEGLLALDRGPGIQEALDYPLRGSHTAEHFGSRGQCKVLSGRVRLCRLLLNRLLFRLRVGIEIRGLCGRLKPTIGPHGLGPVLLIGRVLDRVLLALGHGIATTGILGRDHFIGLLVPIGSLHDLAQWNPLGLAHYLAQWNPLLGLAHYLAQRNPLGLSHDLTQWNPGRWGLVSHDLTERNTLWHLGH